MKRNPGYRLKLMVIGAVESAEGRTRRDRIRKVSETVFHDEQGRACQFTWRTIETWITRYRKYGFASMQSHKTRSDKGSPRNITIEALAEAIDQALPFLRDSPRINRSQLYRTCIEKGFLERGRIAPTTFRRMIREHDLLRQDPAARKEKPRLAFSKEHANDMWQADTLFGPYVTDGRRPCQTKLIAFIDDASRLLCHGEFFFQETTESLVGALRLAFYKRGLPGRLYVDNGSIYCSREITTVCTRLGIILSHTPVRDGAAKGKIERFFRTVRDQFLIRQLDLSSLQTLNGQFLQWVEDEYNAREHSALGMSPHERFGMDHHRLRYLAPSQANDELFMIGETRKVKKDNTFSFAGRRYEAPADLRGRQIQVRFNRSNPGLIVVYFANQRMGEPRLLNPVANDRRPAEAKP